MSTSLKILAVRITNHLSFWVHILRFVIRLPQTLGTYYYLVGSCPLFEIFSGVHVVELCQPLVQNLPRRSLHVILS